MHIIRGKNPRLETLAAVIGRAALEPAAWQDVISAFGAAFPGIGLQFRAADTQGNRPEIGVDFGHDPAFLQSHAERHRHVIPLSAASARRVPGRTYARSALAAGEEDMRTGDCSDWSLPENDLTGASGQLLMGGPDRASFVGGRIPRSLRDALEADFLHVLHSLAPAIRHALQVNREIMGLRAELAASRAGADTEAAALVVLSRDRRVLFANDLAARLLQVGHHVGLSRDGRIVAESSQARSALERLTGLARPGINRVPSLARGELRQLRLIRLSPEEAARLATFPPASSLVPALVLVLAPPVARPDRASSLILNHGLTQAESEVVLRLAAGHSPREIAEERQASIHTVRNQIKAALGKTGLRRQSELAVLGHRTIPG